MANYQRKLLSDGSTIGQPGPLPREIENLSDADVADLTRTLGETCAREIGMHGQGFIPMTGKVTALEFKLRHTPKERIAIRAAGLTDPVVADFLDILDTTGIVELDFQGTKDGVAYLVSLNLLTEERAAAILA